MIKRSEPSSRWQRHRCSSPDMASCSSLLLLVVLNCVTALTLQNGYVALNVHPRKTILSSDQSVGPLPSECQYADCSFLHANTCQEHSLITACCCSSRGNLFKEQFERRNLVQQLSIADQPQPPEACELRGTVSDMSVGNDISRFIRDKLFESDSSAAMW
ncbi:hypothetical protein B566_EDAN012475 [Ephemera danica]|nr:hypothetical protein B566_EDAN012475 [Ephemera danica]